MRVILLQDVPKQGKKNQVISVSDGYAHNYLLKNNLAILANDSNLAKLEKDLDQRKQDEASFTAEMIVLKEKLEKEEFVFKAKVGKKDKMFGSISNKQIFEVLKEKGYNIKKDQIEIIEPINSLGSHRANVHLHKEVMAKLIVIVEK